MQSIQGLTKVNTNELITLNTNVVLFDNTLIIYKLINNNITLLEYNNTFIINDNINLVSVDIITPNEDCILFYIFNNQVNFIQVGIVDQSIYYYNNNSTNQIINNIVKYSCVDPDGVLLETGELEYLGFNIYYKDVTLYDYCIMEILNDIIYYFKNIQEIQTETSGYITLQPNRFQLCAIPNKNENIGYFLDLVQKELDNLNTNLLVSDVINLTKAYPSTNLLSDKYQVYSPGISGDASKFDLMVVDLDNGEHYEINPFFVKTTNFNIDNIKIKWSS